MNHLTTERPHDEGSKISERKPVEKCDWIFEKLRNAANVESMSLWQVISMLQSVKNNFPPENILPQYFSDKSNLIEQLLFKP